MIMTGKSIHHKSFTDIPFPKLLFLLFSVLFSLELLHLFLEFFQFNSNGCQQFLLKRNLALVNHCVQEERQSQLSKPHTMSVITTSFRIPVVQPNFLQRRLMQHHTTHSKMECVDWKAFSFGQQNTDKRQESNVQYHKFKPHHENTNAVHAVFEQV